MKVARVRPAGEFVQGAREVAAHRAAHTPVRKLDDGFVAAGGEELRIDTNFAELVFDNRDPLAVRFPQNAVDQRRLAAAEKAGDDRHRGREAHHAALLLLRSSHGPASCAAGARLS